MFLFGRSWTRRDLEARLGRMDQVAGVRRLRLEEGPEAGVELIHVRTGGGLAYFVSPSRGMDISLAEFRGAPLSWQSANGEAHPAYFDAEGNGWLRTAAGGLLMTCGLTQVGSPNVDGEEHLGIHGRAHHTAARQVTATARWIGDEYVMEVSGLVTETRLFGEMIHLHRTLSSRLGESRLRIHDRIENAGFAPVPFQMLYHFNFGFPLVAEATRIDFPSRVVRPREATTPVDGYDRWESPNPVYAERVYYHEDLATTTDSNGRPIAEVAIRNDLFPGGAIAVKVRWSTDTLPKLVQWKMAGAGMHVLGIEPANCHVGGRAAERAAGTLCFLEPGESVDHHLEIDVEG